MMKKNICFAGFGAEELDTLKQAMGGITSAWDCTFADDATTALESMKARPFDAVVANMQIKGMNGAELLQRVGELHPGALRFVIGDLADQELIINCIGGTHQFISRPYRPQELISIVQRSFALDACLSSDQLRAIAPKLGRLPTLPSTYFEVLKRVESRDASAESVGEVIARDPAATARVLQMVNSAAFALAQKVSDPAHAVLLLGMDTVKSLVLCLQVFNRVERNKQAGFSMEQLWDHSSTVAKMARDIVLHQTADPRLANDAFTAGLLHDMGRIILASNMTKEYSAVVSAARQKACPLHQEELAQLGVTHAQVGAYLLGLWGMPASLVEAAALHHDPNQTSTPEFSMLTAVHVADVFAHENDNPEDGFPRPQLDMAYLADIGLAHKVNAWRKAVSGQPSTGDTEHIKKPAPAPAPAPAPVARTQPKPASKSAPAPAKGLSQPRAKRFLVPAGAALLLAVGLGYWGGWFGSSDSLQVHAKSSDATKALPDTTSASPSASPAPDQAPATTTTSEKPVVTANATPTAPPATPAVPTAAPSAPAVAPAPVRYPTSFDMVKVQGVFYSSNHRTAIINGRLVSPGEHVGTIRVVSIAPSSVVLSCSGEERTFKVK